MEKVAVKVTKSHFDKALSITEKNRPSVAATRVCLLAQAIKDVFPKQTVDVSYTHASVGRQVSTSYRLPVTAKRLMGRFDDNGAWHSPEDRTKKENAALAKLRASLPVSFYLTEE